MITFFTVVLLASCSKSPQYPSPDIKEGSIVIDKATLREGAPEFFSIEIENNRINFFVLVIDGNVESYLDACIRCYKEKKGYRVEGERVVCRACGVTYPVEMLKDGFGSCHPIPIKGTMAKGYYSIALDDIKSGAKYF
ncbi:MAG: DUF2318 domain-containing protein [Nitrospirota bacterium]|nr:MAG: DUF2318 domain-containing protein [Nitrospirota bacterium]